VIGVNGAVVLREIPARIAHAIWIAVYAMIGPNDRQIPKRIFR
jgi:hypothetical protein